MPRNLCLCTCPASVDITFIGHLPDCPTHDQPSDKTQLAIVRRQLTFARKRIRQLEAQRAPAVKRIVRWARQYVRHPDAWTRRQLRQAVRAVEQNPKLYRRFFS